MTNFLVTGGAGFIGSNFVRYVLDNTDASVTVLDKLTYAGNRASLRGLPKDRFAFVQGDICDASLVHELVRDHDLVVHFAAESHNDNSLRDPSPFLTTNLIGTDTLLEAVRRTAPATTTSPPTRCTATFDLDDPERFTEATPYNPSSPYSVDQGRLGPAGPRLGTFLRRAGHDQQLLQQLRSLPACREVHSSPDHQRLERWPAEALRRRPERPRLDPCR